MNSRNGNQAQPLRSMNMNTYGAQPNSRQTPRLQNTQKTGLGNGNAGAGWAFGAPAGGGGAGFGNLGGAPGLSAARPAQLSGFAQIMGGGGQQAQIDMSDFPTLSGPARPQQNNNWNSNVIRQPAPQTQQTPSQTHASQQAQRAPSTAPSHQSLDQFDSQRSQQSADRGGGSDEYPPLSNQGSVNGDSLRQNALGSAVLGSPAESNAQAAAQPTQLPIRDSSRTFPAQPAPIGSGQPTPQSQAQSQPSLGPSNQSSNPPVAVKKWSDMTEDERWGMAGFNAILEARRQIEIGGEVDDTMPPQYRNAMVVMGQDLNALGMDLENPEPLHPSFSVFPSRNPSSSMFDYKDHHPVPAFTVPPAYTVNNVPPMHARMGAFSDETLLQIFFQMPRDINQELAATELSMRDWRWHKVIRRWLQKDTREANAGAQLPIIDLTNGAPIGQPAVRVSDRCERGVYIFFDHENWRRERKEFTLHYDELHVNTLPTAPPGVNGTGQAGGFSGMGGMSGMAGSHVGGPVNAERQNSMISGLS